MNSHNPMNIAADFAKATGGTARKVVALTDKGPLNGFKKFLSRGSMIDMAVGVVMGSDEMADDFNFSDPSHLMRFFKQQTGKTFTQYMTDYNKGHQSDNP